MFAEYKWDGSTAATAGGIIRIHTAEDGWKDSEILRLAEESLTANTRCEDLQQKLTKKLYKEDYELKTSLDAAIQTAREMQFKLDESVRDAEKRLKDVEVLIASGNKKVQLLKEDIRKLRDEAKAKREDLDWILGNK